MKVCKRKTQKMENFNLDDFWDEVDSQLGLSKAPAPQVQKIIPPPVKVQMEKPAAKTEDEVSPETLAFVESIRDKSLTSADFFDAVFNEEESVCFDNSECKNIFSVPYQIGYKEINAFFSINPLIGKRRDANIKAFRNMLFEWDKDRNEVKIPLEEQIRIVEGIELPFLTMLYSGNKSMHYIVSVEEGFENKETYDGYWRAIYNVIRSHQYETPDTSCKNVSRFSRCPGGINSKTGQKQVFLKLGKTITRAELDQWIAQRGGKVEIYKPCEVFETPFATCLESAEKFKVIRSWPERTHGVFRDGNRHNYRVSLFRLCKRAGISKGESIHLVDLHFPLPGDTAHTAWDKNGMEPIHFYADKGEKKAHEEQMSAKIAQSLLDIMNKVK